MSYRRLDMVKELRKLAQGKPTAVHVDRLAMWALEHLSAEVQPRRSRRDRDDSVQWLENLYRLDAPDNTKV